MRNRMRRDSGSVRHDSGLRCECAATARSPDSAKLLNLAARRFSNLTSCERALLVNADINTTIHHVFAVCGPSSNLDDPSNDPKDAALWNHQRDIRAELIRWLCVDPSAIKLIDPDGVAVLGARVIGVLNLDYVRPPFGLTIVRSSIRDLMSLHFADLGSLTLTGSYTGEIRAGGCHVHSAVYMNLGFHASGLVYLGGSRIDNDLNCSGGSFTHNRLKGTDIWAAEEPALILGDSDIQGPIILSEGFQANGAVDITQATFHSLVCYGGRFINPGNVALNALLANISDGVIFSGNAHWGGMEADGIVLFGGAKVGGAFWATGANSSASQPNLMAFQQKLCQSEKASSGRISNFRMARPSILEIPR